MSSLALRHISAYVDMDGPGEYGWVLMEIDHANSRFKQLKSSVGTYASWLAAYNASQIALIFEVDDKKLGPVRAVARSPDSKFPLRCL